MIEYLNSVNYEPHVGRFRSEQVRDREGWGSVSDVDQFASQLHTITVQRDNASQTTFVNVLDPADGAWLDDGTGDSPSPIPAGRSC